jgi:HK97 family phage prohead protease
MPYDISHPDDHTWCVVKSETGEKVHCYPTKKEALDLLAALESNVPDASVRTFERRVFPLQDARVTRADDKTGVLRFHGRPWVYEQLSEDMGGWQEVIRPGAATRTLAADPDVRFLINHNADLLLGRTASGTLHLSEDEAGGIADAQMANVSYARDLAELIDRGDLTQMSFGFCITNDSWSGNLHEVHGFDLDGGDVSAVTFPRSRRPPRGCGSGRSGSCSASRLSRRLTSGTRVTRWIARSTVCTSWSCSRRSESSARSSPLRVDRRTGREPQRNPCQ